jgi:hypothetical protein
MEWIAEAINPRQTLITGGSLHDLMAATAGQQAALSHFTERIDSCDWALVRARRAMDAKNGDPRRARHRRPVADGGGHR